MGSGVVVITGQKTDPVLIATTEDTDRLGVVVQHAMKMAPLVTDPKQVADTANAIYGYSLATTSWNFKTASQRLLENPQTFLPKDMATAIQYQRRLLNAGYGDAGYEINTVTGDVLPHAPQSMPSVFSARRRALPTRKAPRAAKRCSCRRR
jgi:hypothetical protein